MSPPSPHSLPPPPVRLGTWLSLGSPVVAELAAECGFDWLLFDLEHGASTDATLLPQLQALKGTSSQAIVRLGMPHPDQILRALDWGARGIMAPHVNNAAEAEAVVRAASYPPRGHRGYSRSARVYGYGLRTAANPSEIPAPLIMAQIESLEGVSQAASIATVEGVDVLFVGPADLQFDLAVRLDSAPPTYQECLQRVVEAAAAAGKASGILVRDAADLAQHRELGFTYIALDSDLAILRKGFQALRKAG